MMCFTKSHRVMPAASLLKSGHHAGDPSCIIECLPDDVLLDIFRKLEPFESHKKNNFRAVSQVCRRWYSVASASRRSLSISGFKAHRIPRVLARFTHLQSLNLNFLFDCSENALAVVGDTCPYLRDLDISDSYKAAEGGWGMVKLLQGCRQLETLSLPAFKGPGSALRMIGSCCTLLKRLRLRSCSSLNDDVMTHIATNCRYIEELDVSFTEITDAALAAVGGHLSALRQLDVKHCKSITGSGIAALAAGCRLLQSLHLGLVDCGDEGIIALGTYSCDLEELYLDYGWDKWGRLSCRLLGSVARGCRKLRLLSLRGSKQVNDEVLQGLLYGCPSLKLLDLHACENVGDIGLQAVTRGCKQLEDLVLSGTRVGAVSSTPFQGRLDNLQSLRLSGDNVTDAVLKSISANCKRLSQLHLANCSHVSDASVEELLKGCSELKQLTAKCCPLLTGTGFSSLAPSLEWLSLPLCGITDNGLLMTAQNCKNLSHLAIPQCRNVSATTVMSALGSCTHLKELVIVGCLQISREEIIKIVKASGHGLKTIRVSRPDSPQDEYTIKRQGGWTLPSWARSPSSPR
jgi:F-box/leucine-rich repeat protein 2/20